MRVPPQQPWCHSLPLLSVDFAAACAAADVASTSLVHQLHKQTMVFTNFTTTRKPSTFPFPSTCSLPLQFSNVATTWQVPYTDDVTHGGVVLSSLLGGEHAVMHRDCRVCAPNNTDRIKKVSNDVCTIVDRQRSQAVYQYYTHFFFYVQ